jgi:hypothetical protein
MLLVWRGGATYIALVPAHVAGNDPRYLTLSAVPAAVRAAASSAKALAETVLETQEYALAGAAKNATVNDELAALRKRLGDASIRIVAYSRIVKGSADGGGTKAA